jgi:hypothetical protein
MLALLSACQSSPAALVPLGLEVAVQSDHGVRLSGVDVLIDGEVAGKTSKGGVLATVVWSRPGLSHRVEPECPSPKFESAVPTVLRFRSYSPDATQAPLELSLTCRPAERLAAFLVKAINGSGLPVLLNGEVVATTNEDGIAHFSASGRPGSEYLVQIDASEVPRLLPRTLSQAFVLPDSHELFVIEHSFELRPAAAQTRARRSRIIKIE